MKIIRADFVIKTDSKHSTVIAVGRSTVDTPSIQYTGSGIKWFDDSLLLKDKSRKVV